MRALFFLLLPLILFADVDEKLVKIESKLFSKIIFLDYDYQQKLQNGHVTMAILYDTTSHQHIAESFVKFLNNQKLFGERIKAWAVDVRSMVNQQPPTAYITVLERDQMATVSQELIKKKRLLFSYQPSLIKYAMVTIEMGHRILPFINPKLLKLGGIELRPIIFKVAKVYNYDN
ncbi:MAG: hypothetical protein DSY46_05650 [Hydrogenimonas sp.]|nr:MAG: hypothetical protein DSY46_05650 [Hydrogenimonas sp.]